MVWRTVIGQHPTGNVGLFVSKPGVDAFGNDPGNRNAWMFSSAIDKQANILQAGRCNLNDVVTFPNIGSVPMVFFDLYNGQYGWVSEAQSSSDGNSAYTMYRCAHVAINQIQIVAQSSGYAPPAGSYFRYIIFTVSQDG